MTPSDMQNSNLPENDTPEQKMERLFLSATNYGAVARGMAELSQRYGQIIRIMESGRWENVHLDVPQAVAKLRRQKKYYDEMARNLMFVGATLLFPTVGQEWKAYVRSSGVAALFSQAGVDAANQRLQQAKQELDRIYAKTLGEWDN